MKSVLKRAQDKKLSHKKLQDVHGVCQKSEDSSRQILQQFQSVIQHFEEHAEDEQKCREALRQLYESHEFCYASNNVAAPHE
ncbi:hypothetical protein HC752_08585 [Vibrio sp. S9_S30]|uniref:hypothetical protein n=1 Tax=Vibrio sp. S9_S30 TaxID=2720226 RepID=UPI001681C0D7|nr:hypothetical protein [Vibrio sp. S9_S30]MBD1556992.1 hypothetical protein [Vibrio sp. S9_S30]